MDDFGFIMTRHVNSKQTNNYWNHAVQKIKLFYPKKKIIIIDDNSNKSFLKADFDYKNVTIIQSEYNGRGELLPYYYYIKNNWFKNAIIIHDSVFIQRRFKFESLINHKVNVAPLWVFPKIYDAIDVHTINLIDALPNNNILKKNIKIPNYIDSLGFIKENEKWNGCFGVQSFINRNFLLETEQRFKISNLVRVVKTRNDRCCLERIFGVIFYLSNKNKSGTIKPLFGNIFENQKWGYSYEKYSNDVSNKKIKKGIIKVWTGR
jgi:hypothetical protein